MSTKTASPRKGTPSRAQKAAQMTSTPLDRDSPAPGTSSRAERESETPERPVSPGLMTRDDEKRQLSHLNNRLAAYIDHVNRLQGENQRLTQNVRRIEEQRTVEITSIKSDYQREISALRGLADEEAKTRATAQAEADNLRKQLDRLSNVNNQLTGDFDRATHRVGVLEKENADLKSRYEAANTLLTQKRRELDEVKKQLLDSEASLKAERVIAATLRNKVESSKDEGKFQKETFERELQQARTITQEEITEIDGRAQVRFDQQLQEKIEEFRRVYEIEKRDLRQRMEDEVQQRLQGYVPLGDFAQMESKMKTMTQELTMVRSDLEDKKRLLDQERGWIAAQLKAKDEQIAEANGRYRDLKKEFDDLLDIRDGLQKELDTYRVLLEQEESRLNISASTAQSPSQSSFMSSRKRKRLSSAFESTEGIENMNTEFSNSGPIQVFEHDAIHGKYVTLENVSSEDVGLGGWRIIHKSGEHEASHKFPQRFKIKAKSKVTLWSSDSGGAHNPPNSYLLKDIKFPSQGNSGGEIQVETILHNVDEEEVARRVSRKRHSSTTTLRKFSRLTPQRVTFSSAGEVFHMQGDGDAVPMDDSRCSIM